MSRLLRLCVMALIATVCLSLLMSQTDAVPVETLQQTSQAVIKGECADGNPCGWAVYGDNDNRKTKYFIRNTCLCKQGSSCLLGNEDLSLTAYVYRCSRDNVTEIA